MNSRTPTSDRQTDFGLALTTATPNNDHKRGYSRKDFFGIPFAHHAQGQSQRTSAARHNAPDAKRDVQETQGRSKAKENAKLARATPTAGRNAHTGRHRQRLAKANPNWPESTSQCHQKPHPKRQKTQGNPAERTPTGRLPAPGISRPARANTPYPKRAGGLYLRGKQGAGAPQASSRPLGLACRGRGHP